MLPFLKWAGGKRWLTREFAERLPTFGTYHEPFLGGGAMYFEVLPTIASLSDANPDLVETYLAIQEDPELLKNILAQHQVMHCDEYYYEMRASSPSERVERAARFIYLNRTCWNGLYRVNKLGKFNVPRGTKSIVLDAGEDFREISRALEGAVIQCCDFERAMDTAKEGDFIYADPPYTVKHNMNGFVKYNQDIFSWEDQVRLRDAAIRAQNRGVNVSISNADHASLHALYERATQIDTVSRASVISGLSKGRGSTTEIVAHFWVNS